MEPLRNNDLRQPDEQSDARYSDPSKELHRRSRSLVRRRIVILRITEERSHSDSLNSDAKEKTSQRERCEAKAPSKQ